MSDFERAVGAGRERVGPAVDWIPAWIDSIVEASVNSSISARANGDWVFQTLSDPGPSGDRIQSSRRFADAAQPPAMLTVAAQATRTIKVRGEENVPGTFLKWQRLRGWRPAL